MLITISEKWFNNCQDKKYLWGDKKFKDNIRAGNTWEVATQKFLGLTDKNIKLREGKKGVDCGIDCIVESKKYQCKSCLLDGKKNFVLLDSKINYNVDYYSLGKVYDDFKQCELVAMLPIAEILHLIKYGKILYHSQFLKWAYLLCNTETWEEEQYKRGTLKRGLIQDINAVIYTPKTK